METHYLTTPPCNNTFQLRQKSSQTWTFIVTKIDSTHNPFHCDTHGLAHFLYICLHSGIENRATP